MTNQTDNTTVPLPSLKMPVIDRYRRWTTPWWRFIKPLLESVNKNSIDLTAVSEDLTTSKATINSQLTVLANEDIALASRIDTVEAAYQTADSDLSAAITSEATARINADGVLAQTIDTVTTTVNDNTASIQTLTQTSDGYAGKWTLSLNVNGRVTGRIQLNGTNETSEISFLTNRFFMVSPVNNNDVKTVFDVVTINGIATVGIAGNVIADNAVIARHILADSITADKIAANAVTADKINVNSLSSVAADVGTVTAGVLRSADGLMVIDLNNKSITMSV